WKMLARSLEVGHVDLDPSVSLGLGSSDDRVVVQKLDADATSAPTLDVSLAPGVVARDHEADKEFSSFHKLPAAAAARREPSTPNAMSTTIDEEPGRPVWGAETPAPIAHRASRASRAKEKPG